jgi:hypothetical protein
MSLQDSIKKSIAARFWVRSTERFSYQRNSNGQTGWAEPAPVITVKMGVVTGGRAEENKKWASATPHGEITMTIGNPEAAQWFIDMQEAGMDIAVTFSARPADEVQS